MRKILLLGLIVFMFFTGCANKSKTVGGVDGLIVDETSNLIDLNRSIEGSLVQGGTTENPSYYIATTENKYYWLNNKDPNLLKLKGSDIYTFQGNIVGSGVKTRSGNLEENTITVERAISRDKISLSKKIILADPGLNKFQMNVKLGSETTPIYFYKSENYDPSKVFNVTGNLYYNNGQFYLNNVQISETDLIEVHLLVAKRIYPKYRDVGELYIAQIQAYNVLKNILIKTYTNGAFFDSFFKEIYGVIFLQAQGRCLDSECDNFVNQHGINWSGFLLNDIFYLLKDDLFHQIYKDNYYTTNIADLKVILKPNSMTKYNGDLVFYRVLGNGSQVFQEGYYYDIISIEKTME